MENAILEKMKNMGAEIEKTMDRFMGDESMYLHFLTQIPENQEIVELVEAVKKGDAEQARNKVHTLKGVALNLGLLPIANECAKMLTAFHDGKDEEAMSMLPEVQEVFKEWSDFVSSIR